MKKYVLLISDKFPKYHRRAGENTNFERLITEGKKIHTIRSNYNFWEKRIKQVQEGKAVLSIRKWSGLPYRSKKIEIKQLNKDDGIGIERIKMYKSDAFYLLNLVRDDFELVSKKSLLKNDGLNTEDFESWFFYGAIEPIYVGCIIHFTDFRYSKK